MAPPNVESRLDPPGSVDLPGKTPGSDNQGGTTSFNQQQPSQSQVQPSQQQGGNFQADASEGNQGGISTPRQGQEADNLLRAPEEGMEDMGNPEEGIVDLRPRHDQPMSTDDLDSRYKNMQRDYTKKTQKVSERNRALDERERQLQQREQQLQQKEAIEDRRVLPDQRYDGQRGQQPYQQYPYPQVPGGYNPGMQGANVNVNPYSTDPRDITLEDIRRELPDAPGDLELESPAVLSGLKAQVVLGRQQRLQAAQSRMEVQQVRSNQMKLLFDREAEKQGIITGETSDVDAKNIEFTVASIMDNLAITDPQDATIPNAVRVFKKITGAFVEDKGKFLDTVKKSPHYDDIKAMVLEEQQKLQSDLPPTPSREHRGEVGPETEKEPFSVKGKDWEEVIAEGKRRYKG